MTALTQKQQPTNNADRKVSKPFKLTAALLSATILATGLLPTQQAFAGDRWDGRTGYGYSEQRPLRRGIEPRVERRIERRVERRVDRRLDRRLDRRAERRAIAEEQRRIARKKARKAERRDNRRDMVAAGLIGLAVGAIIASSNQQDHAPRTVYQPYPQPNYPQTGGSGYHQRVPLDQYQQPVDLGTGGGYIDEPRVITYEETAAPEPWTQAWYQYCTNRFRSFDADSGTYLGYDNRRHFCVAK